MVSRQTVWLHDNQSSAGSMRTTRMVRICFVYLFLYLSGGHSANILQQLDKIVSTVEETIHQNNGPSGVTTVDETDKAEESIDETIVNAAKTPEEFEFLDKGDVRIEYDMVFSRQRWNEINAMSRQKRAMPVKRQDGVQRFRWTNSLIPYEFSKDDHSNFTPREKQNVLDAMATWTNYTCLTFTPSNTARNRILFKDGDGCNSHVGMVGGAQSVHLAIGCRYTDTATHEIGHAIGLIHEQTRPDRDRYVRVIKDNIPMSQLYNFDVVPLASLQDLSIPYDYLSIMHYGSKSFSETGQRTIETKDKRYQQVIGTRERPSFRDIKTVNLMYNCGRATKGCRLTDSQCPGEGFVGKDCKCWCPAQPYKVCSPVQGKENTKTNTKGSNTVSKGGKTIPGEGKSNLKEACKDRHTRCSFWESHQECSRSPGYMNVYCKKTCKTCTGRPLAKDLEDVCVDNHLNCSVWARTQHCHAPGYQSYMLTNCRRSCEVCTTPDSSSKDSDSKSASCVDGHPLCLVWAKAGHCQTNTAFMMTSCKKACHVC